MARKECKYNYNLKSKKDEKSLVVIIGYFNGKWTVSTTQSVYVKTWDNEKQRCIISTSFSDRINRASRKVNKFLDCLDVSINKYMENVYKVKRVFNYGWSRYRDVQDKYEQIGDAVPPLLAYAWGKTILNIFNNHL